MATLDLLSQLSHRALRIVVGASTRSYIVPLSAAEVRERAPSVVTEPETFDHSTMEPRLGGLFDPGLFGGTQVRWSDSREQFPAADEVVAPSAARFARVSICVPTLHPLFAEHVREEVAERIGWDPFGISAVASPADCRRLCDALETAGLGALVLRELPVLPPAYRPFEGGTVGGPTDLYRRIVNANKRLARAVELDAPEVMVGTAHRMLNGALHALFENDEMPEGHPDIVTGPDGAAYPSLRALCMPTNGQLDRGTVNLWRDLSVANDELQGRSCNDATVPMPFRVRVARAVLFAMGFDLRAR